MIGISRFAEDGVHPGGHAEQYRFPIVRNPYPRWKYITAVVVSTDIVWDGIQPTDAELAVVGSFHDEYCSYFFGPPSTGFRAKMEAGYPFDIDGGANARILAKVTDGEWRYRQASWTRGPDMVPERDDTPLGLVPLLDRIHSIGDKVMDHWSQWKTDHASVFAAVTG